MLLSTSDWAQGSAVRVLLMGNARNTVRLDTFVNNVNYVLGNFAVSFDHSTVCTF